MKKFFVLCLFPILASCGLGQSNLQLPQQRPVSTINGQALHIQHAQIQAFAFTNDGKGEWLGSSQSDDHGQFSLTLRSKSQPILLEVSAGDYIEPASGNVIALDNDLQLSAPSLITMGKTHTIEISPFSHLLTALTLQRIQQGDSVEQALNTANQQLRDGLQLDLLTPTEEMPISTKAAMGNFHLAYSMAVSFLTQWANQQNGSQQHQGYHSVSLAKLLYLDALNDGLLNGQIRKNDGQTGSLALGSIPLNADSYRMGLAQQLLAAANALENEFTAEELLTRAKQIISNQSDLFNQQSLQPVASMLPKISAKPQLILRGQIPLDLAIDSPIAIDLVKYQIPNLPSTEASDTSQPSVLLNSLNYPDGLLRVAIEARDILGNRSQTTLQFSIDNVYFSLDSTLQADNVAYPISGSYAGDASEIRINDQLMQLNKTNHTWSGNLLLQQGQNDIHGIMLTSDGQRDEKTFSIAIQDAPPVFAASSLGHGKARLDPSNNFIPLQDHNLTPLAMSDSQLDLAGTVVTRNDLDQAGIAYFAFRAHDTDRTGQPMPQSVSVNYRYFINDVEQASTRQPLRDQNDFLIPLASETLDNQWHQVTPLDKHRLEVTVTDAANQTASKNFSFQLNVLPPALTLSNISPPLQIDTFSNRQAYSGATFSVINQEISNTSSKDFLLYLDDAGSYSLTQSYEQKTSEHKVNKILDKVWQITLPDHAFDGSQCPSTSDVKSQEVDYLFKYNGATTNNGFIRVNKPQGIIEQTININSAALPANIDDTPTPLHLDSNHAYNSTDNFHYDYMTNPWADTAAYISSRTANVYDAGSNTFINQTCSEIHTLYQINRIRYESVTGYPLNQRKINTSTGSGKLHSFIAKNLNTGQTLTAENGWYRIAAGNKVLISKKVLLPSFTVYNDPLVKTNDFDAFTSRYLDKLLEWKLSTDIRLRTAHNIADITQVSQMTQAEQKFGLGIMTLSISRP